MLNWLFLLLFNKPHSLYPISWAHFSHPLTTTTTRKVSTLVSTSYLWLRSPGLSTFSLNYCRKHHCKHTINSSSFLWSSSKSGILVAYKSCFDDYIPVTIMNHILPSFLTFQYWMYFREGFQKVSIYMHAYVCRSINCNFSFFLSLPIGS